MAIIRTQIKTILNTKNKQTPKKKDYRDKETGNIIRYT